MSYCQPSRVGADFSLELFDWNQLEQAKSLGSANIDLTNIEPFEAAELDLNLISKKHGEKGHVRLRLMFQPEIIAKSRKNTSTFSTAGRAMTTVGGVPLNVGKGVVHGVTGVFKRGHNKGGEEELVPSDLPAGQASAPVNTTEALNGGASFPAAKSSFDDIPTSGTHEPGTLRVSVLDAKDLSTGDSKAYATIRVGDKEHKTKHSGKTAFPEWYGCSAYLSLHC